MLPLREPHPRAVTEYFLDTNVILRHLLRDDSVLSPAAQAIIRAIEEGSITAWTTDLAVAEVVFVLSSKRLYNRLREEVASALLPIIGLPHFKIQNKRIYDRAFALYTSSPIDFIDAFHVATMEARGERDILSFDTDFDGIPGIARYTSVI
jgi:predicted nucleic acid-binding protein